MHKLDVVKKKSPKSIPLTSIVRRNLLEPFTTMQETLLYVQAIEPLKSIRLLQHVLQQQIEERLQEHVKTLDPVANNRRLHKFFKQMAHFHQETQSIMQETLRHVQQYKQQLLRLQSEKHGSLDIPDHIEHSLLQMMETISQKFGEHKVEAIPILNLVSEPLDIVAVMVDILLDRSG